MPYQDILAIIISLYGLGIYHYYIVRSSAESVPVISTPCLLLICFWLKNILSHVSHSLSRKILLVLTSISAFALITTHGFLRYPNVMNFTQKTFTLEKQVLKESLLGSKDLELISRLTKSQEGVCLFSSQDTVILMQADRKPYLYYVPIMLPRSFKIRDFGGLVFFNQERFQKTIQDLDTKRISYVFMEKKLFELPKFYYAHFESLRLLLEYLRNHYELEFQGESLVALKRKD